MTYRTGRHAFSAGGVSACLAVAAALAVSGCASTADPEVYGVGPAMTSRSGGPIDTGTYPNLNIAPKAATSQFTPDESKAKLARLDSARARQSPGYSGETPEARKKRLKLLADENQANTLKVIEEK